MGFFSKYITFRVLTRKSKPPEPDTSPRVWTTAEIIVNRSKGGMTEQWVKAADAVRTINELTATLRKLKTAAERLKS